jgi:hypothetical protein
MRMPVYQMADPSAKAIAALQSAKAREASSGSPRAMPADSQARQKSLNYRTQSLQYFSVVPLSDSSAAKQ